MFSPGLFRTLSVAALLCGLSSAALASANPPLDAWTVGPINAQSDTGVGYCSMKTSYGSGQSLVLARDQEGSNSLAVDFGQKTLKTGQPYAVTLHVGSLSRQVPAIAATPSVLIAQTGFDRSLYTAIARQDSLRVDLQGMQLDFGLEGSAEGLQALGDCAQGLASGSVAVKLPAVTVAVAKTENPLIPTAELRKPELKNPELEKLRFENQVLKDERVAIVAQLEEADAAREKIAADYEGQIGKLKKQAEKNRAIPAAYEEKMEALKAENERLAALEKENERLRAEAANARKMAARLEKTLKEKPKAPVVAAAAPRKTLGELLRQAGAKSEKDWPADESFQSMVTDYLGHAAATCDGDFAQSVGAPESRGGAKMLEAETACMGAKGDEAAALLFVGDQGKFIVYAKDGAAGQMNLALEQRSALLEKIDGLASR